MRTILTGLLAALALPQTAGAAEVELWRLDCGEILVRDQAMFSDSFALPHEARPLTDSCYLVRHDDEYLLWDTGLPGGLAGQPATTDPAAAFVPVLNRTIASQLTDLGLAPGAITRVGISHGHFDHTGQAADFPGATLLIGAADDAAFRGDTLPFGFDPGSLAPWLTGDSPLDPVTGDRDIWGDGTATILAMPGHTDGETALLVNLADTGPVLLSGDVAHFHGQLEGNVVPSFNADRAESLASMARLREVAANLGATLVIQHEPADVGLLPAFPESAK